MQATPATRFMAIGVPCGDAFFIELESGFTALVDGGRSAAGFPCQFTKATGRTGVDVLVCTHNDADHANGVLGFLREGLSCAEVWLPGSWATAIGAMERDPAAERLACEASAREEPAESLEQLGEKLSAGPSERVAQADSGGASPDAPLERCFGEREGAENGWPWWLRWESPPYAWGPRSLFLEAVGAGGRIRQIAELAYHRGCRVRWLQYCGSPGSGGIPGSLVSVNAREVTALPPPPAGTLAALALTTANRESLVYHCPAGPGVLFTADSELVGLSVPWRPGMLITAPHHGSQANAKAYAGFNAPPPNTPLSTWVRSDGRYKTRPGQCYVALDARKYCTLCRGSSRPKQDVELSLVGGVWQPSPKTQQCACI